LAPSPLPEAYRQVGEAAQVPGGPRLRLAAQTQVREARQQHRQGDRFLRPDGRGDRARRRRPARHLDHRPPPRRRPGGVRRPGSPGRRPRPAVRPDGADHRAPPLDGRDRRPRAGGGRRPSADPAPPGRRWSTRRRPSARTSSSRGCPTATTPRCPAGPLPWRSQPASPRSPGVGDFLWPRPCRGSTRSWLPHRAGLPPRSGRRNEGDPPGPPSLVELLQLAEPPPEGREAGERTGEQLGERGSDDRLGIAQGRASTRATTRPRRLSSSPRSWSVAKGRGTRRRLWPPTCAPEVSRPRRTLASSRPVSGRSTSPR
jgi:hypothetical protein